MRAAVTNDSMREFKVVKDVALDKFDHNFMVIGMSVTASIHSET